MGGERAQAQLVDIILGLIVLIGGLVLAPVYYKFINMVTAEADPFTALVMQLFVPAVFISLVIGFAVSARRQVG